LACIAFPILLSIDRLDDLAFPALAAGGAVVVVGSILQATFPQLRTCRGFSAALLLVACGVAGGAFALKLD